MKRKLLLSLSLLSLLSCKKEEDATSVIKDSAIGTFEEIDLSGVFEVYLTQDTTFSIKIEGNTKMIEQVHYKIENNVLRIYNDNSDKWRKPEDNKIKLYITSDSLKKVTANQTCYIETTNPIITNEFGIVFGSKLNEASLLLNCTTFYYWNNHPCGGKLTLSGNTKNLRIWNFALMAVDATNLNSEDALVENSSQGDCKITATNRLEYSIKNSGNIYLYGSPAQIVLKEKTSTGQLIQ